MPRRRGNKKVNWVKHYNNKQKILLVGEGDFSFSACLAAKFGSATNMVATSLDSEFTLRTKHSTSKANLELLKSKGCLVLHGVDVQKMNQHPILSQMKFDIIVFNFPHAGFFPPLGESNSEVIKRHQKLVEGFFRSAREMIHEDGEVHLAHRDDHPYNQWNVTELAEKAGLVLKEKVEFLKEDYPGYHNKRSGSGSNSNRTFRLGDCHTFKFSLNADHGIKTHISINDQISLKFNLGEEIDGVIAAPIKSLMFVHDDSIFRLYEMGLNQCHFFGKML